MELVPRFGLILLQQRPDFLEVILHSTALVGEFVGLLLVTLLLDALNNFIGLGDPVFPLGQISIVNFHNLRLGWLSQTFWVLVYILYESFDHIEKRCTLSPRLLVGLPDADVEACTKSDEKENNRVVTVNSSLHWCWDQSIHISCQQVRVVTDRVGDFNLQPYEVGQRRGTTYEAERAALRSSSLKMTFAP